MTFQNDDGEVLDIPGQVFITKRSVNFFNSKILGDYSVNFDVPNNSVNRKVLGYNGPQMLNQVAYRRQSFTLMRNGTPLERGFIVIQADNGVSLSCFFLSGNSNWINLLNGLITELDYSGLTNATDYEMQLTSTNVYNAMAATSGVVFPMVDWCYKLNKGNNEWFIADLLDTKADIYQTFFELYPCFYLKTLVKEIMQQNGLKLGGNILDDGIYQSLALTPASGEVRRDHIDDTTAIGTNQSTSSGSFQTYVNLTETTDPEGLFTGGQYTANRNSKVYVLVTVTSNTSGVLAVAEIQVDIGGVTTNFVLGAASGVGLGVYTVVGTVVPGSVIRVRFRNNGAGTATIAANLRIEIPTIISANDYFRPEMFLPRLKGIDILQAIINSLGCSAYYDQYSKTVVVTIIEKLKLEDAYDFSDYYQSHTVEYSKAAANNYLRLEASEESNLRAYDNGRTVKWGEANIETQSTLNQVAELVKIPFAASDFGISKNGDWLTNIGLVDLQDQEPILFTAVSNDGSGNAVYSFTGATLTRGQVMRIVDTSSGDAGYFIVNAFTSGSPNLVTFYGRLYAGSTSTGLLYPQQRTLASEIKPRLLIVKPSTVIDDFSSTVTTYNMYSSAFSATSRTTSAFGHFAKSQTGQTIDTFKASAAFGNPDLSTYIDPSIKELYFRKISNMIGNPLISIKLLLPEAVYQSFKFDQFIYIKTEKLTGYFWISNLSNYVDATTAVDVTALMV